MKIHIQKIHSAGMELDESLPAQWTGHTQKDSIRFVAPVAIKAKITRVDDELLAKIHAVSRYETMCDRCLESIERDWTTSFMLNFEIEKRMEFIEIDEDIRQEMILNLPSRILCQDNCRGLCIDCGVNLNKQECEHKHSVVSG